MINDWAGLRVPSNLLTPALSFKRGSKLLEKEYLMNIKIKSQNEKSTLYLSGNFTKDFLSNLKKSLSKIYENKRIREITFDFKDAGFVGSFVLETIVIFSIKLMS